MTASMSSLRAGLVEALQDKLQGLIGSSSGYIESLPTKVKERVEVLKTLQERYNDLEAAFFEEKNALEQKYQHQFTPFYQKRYEIVNGITDVTTDKSEEKLEKYDIEDQTKTTEESPEKKDISDVSGIEEKKSHGISDETAIDVKGVPEFWLTAMSNNDILGMQISERDEPVLRFLKDIRWFRLTNAKGFKLEFIFNENPYFKNTVLTKTYFMVDENEPVLETAEGCEIEWFPGKNVTQKITKRKAKRGPRATKAVVPKIEKCNSFFNFFSPPKIDGEFEDDEADDLQELMEEDYDIGTTIRDKLIPHAVSWFTGEALEGIESDDEEPEEDEDIESDEDEDNESEDEYEDSDLEEDEDEDKDDEVDFSDSYYEKKDETVEHDQEQEKDGKKKVPALDKEEEKIEQDKDNLKENNERAVNHVLIKMEQATDHAEETKDQVDDHDKQSRDEGKDLAQGKKDEVKASDMKNKDKGKDLTEEIKDQAKVSDIKNKDNGKKVAEEKKDQGKGHSQKNKDKGKSLDQKKTVSGQATKKA